MNPFQRGYDWALAALREGDLSPEEIEANLECSADFGDTDDFDRGAEAALRDWKERRETQAT